MGVDYWLNYHIRIKGSRADIKRIPSILKANSPFCDYVPDKWYWMTDKRSLSILKRKIEKFISTVKECLAQEGDNLVLSTISSEGSGTNGMIEAMINCINVHLPNLGIAIVGFCPGDEYYESEDMHGFFYSPENEEKRIYLTGAYGFECSDSSIFPVVDWIPEYFRTDEK